MPFLFEKTELEGVVHIQPRIFSDSRGFFLETFKQSDFIQAGINENFVQSNFSHSTQDTLRGLHFQKNPSAQGKLVLALAGVIFDVAIDVRKSSPTFGKWVSRTLSAEKRNMLYIPAGFAHGFCVLSDTADVMYCCTREYAPRDEAGIIWNDPQIAVTWPVSAPLLSEKDTRLPLLAHADNNFIY